jgi:murein DD-endopeptidase MepM/ murein hydrolase activator NlpD
MSRAPRPRRPRGLGSLLLVVLTAGMIAVPGLRPTAADELGDKQAQRDQVNKQMDRLRAAIQGARDEEAKVKLIIQSIDLQISQTEANINDAQVKLDKIGRELSDAQTKLAETRDRLARDKKELSQQLIFIYKQGQTSMMNKVLGSKTFNEFWQKLIDLRRLAGSQQDVLSAVQIEEKQVDALVAEITDKQAKQKVMLADLRTQADGLQVQLGARQAAVAHLEQVQAENARRLAEAEQAARELDAQIAAIKAAMEAARRRGGGNGHFVWPEGGPITQDFGCSPYPFEPWDPNCPSRHFHTGIDIGAPWGTPIVAADTGIAYTYYSGYGFGNHIIIVHGNGWVSVYGHMASFAVGNGQGVGRGQTIGYEGSTGNSTGPHLHFEIRLNDVPRNPIQYLP